MKIKPFIITAAVLALTACGGNKQQQEDSAEVEEVAVEETGDLGTDVPEQEEQTPAEEESGYKAPFEFTATKTYYKMIASEWLPDRVENLTGRLDPRGRFTGTVHSVDYMYDYGVHEGTPVDSILQDFDISGKWSTTYITMGEGSQKTYTIDTTSNDNTWYMPDDCKYIWCCESAWYECENWNTDKAFKITSAKQL